MLAFLLSLITGAGGITSSLEKAYADKLNSKTAEDQIAAGVLLQQIQTQQAINITAMGHKTFWVVWGMFAGSLALWWAAVLVNTIFAHFGSWGIGTVPDQLIPWANIIFNAVFYSGAGVTSVGLVTGAAQRIFK